jgi:hypothetical protein
VQLQIEEDVAAEARAEPGGSRSLSHEELEPDLENTRRFADELGAPPGGSEIRIVERKNEALARIVA